MEAAISELLTPLTESRRAHTLEVGRKLTAVAHHVPEHLREEAVTAAYLHDVGYGYPETGFHPIDGADLLAARGFSAVVCNLVAFHSSSEIEANVRGLDPNIFDPYRLADSDGLKLATDLVWWADMTTGPSGETVTIDQRLADIRNRYVDGSIVRKSIDQSEPLLRAAVQRVSGSM